MRAIIIPVYNGAAYLEKTFQELLSFIKNSTKVYTIILVNDGSIDDTGALLEEYKKNSGLAIVIVSYKKNQGKGYAIKEGMKRVPVEVNSVAFTDVDLPYGTDVLEKGFEIAESGISFVYGSRTEAEKKQRQYSLYRKIGARIFRLCLPHKVRLITDTQSGLKIFRKPDADLLFSLVKTDESVFDIELFLIASANSMSIKELPVALKFSSITRRGGVHVMKHGLRILSDIVKIRMYALRGIYTKKKQ